MKQSANIWPAFRCSECEEEFDTSCPANRLGLKQADAQSSIEDGAPQAWYQPAEALSMEEDVQKTLHRMTCYQNR
ncbi:hypothetical protein [Rubripirellula reticaptiva]|uniref:hypothetical protein n=1 Tax=Rubripirellula reticaptiva TaxID=2528013 RepID=UPI0016475C00|nr:hypothetical protein [Rubripirellula reticaptiva]